MNNTINSDLIRGNIDTIILRALYGGDRYGYDIIKEIEQRSSGKYKLKQPTLYSCLNRLENQGFIHSYWGAKSIGGRRKYYTLTDMGKELFIKNKTDWLYSKSLIDDLIVDESAYSMTDLDEESTIGDIDNESTSDSLEEGYHDQIMDKTNDDTEGELSADESNGDSDGEFSSDENEDDAESTLSDDNSGDDAGYEGDEADVLTLCLDEGENTAYLDSLLSVSASSNYTTRLSEEEYTPSKNIYTDEHLRTDNYFKDFDDDSYEDEFDAEDQLEEKNPPAEDDDDSFRGSVLSDEYIPIVSEQAPPPRSIFRTEPAVSETFLDYKTTDPKTVAGQNQHGPRASEELYRFFEEKIASAKSAVVSPTRYTNSPPQTPKEDSGYVAHISEKEIVPSDEPEFIRKDQIQIRNFKRLQESAANLGEDIKIRSYEGAASRQFNQQYYYFSNKLKLSQYFVLFCFVLIEVVLCYAVINMGLRKSLTVPTAELLMYVFAVLFGMAFPTTAFLLNWNNPNKRSRINYSFKTQLLFSVLVMVLLLMIIYFTNVAFHMPLTLSPEYYTTLFLPAAMTLNLPINAIIFKIIFSSKRYAV